MKIFYLFYVFQFQIFYSNIINNKILVGNFFQTLGVKINVYLKKDNKQNICFFNQTNINGEEVLNFNIYNFKSKKIFQINKVQNTEGVNIFQKVTAIGFTPSEIKFQQVDNINENSKKEIKNLSTINLYGFLKVINNLKIFDGYKPDYNRLFMEEKEETLTRKFHEIYYRLNGFSKKHTENAYINDSRNYTMGNILGLFGNPIFIFLSGTGEETFLYMGIHECENKRLISFMLIQFDLYSKVMKYFHYIPLCEKCHKNYSIKEIVINENKDKY